MSFELPWPRRGQPWSVVEDDRLIRLLRQAERLGYASSLGYGADTTFGYAAKKLGRTTCAVQTRYLTLKACGRHCTPAPISHTRRGYLGIQRVVQCGPCARRETRAARSLEDTKERLRRDGWSFTTRTGWRCPACTKLAKKLRTKEVA